MNWAIKVLLAVLAAVVVSVILLFAVLSIFVAKHTSTDVLKHKNGTVLEIDLSGIITEEPALFDPMIFFASYAAPKVTLFDAIIAIEMASEDANVKAISLKMDGRGVLSLAHAYELQLELEQFKANSGKKVFAYAQDMTQVEYLLACSADEIFLHPLGSVEWRGVATYSPYFKGLFDSIGVTAEVFRPEACVYKSAVEPFSRENMSPESRAQSKRLVDNIWGNVLQSVATKRNIQVERLSELAKQQVILSGEEAISSHMIDRLAYYDQYEALLIEQGVAYEKYDADDYSSSGLRSLSLSEYVSFMEFDTTRAETADSVVALIYIDGQIVSGESDPSEALVGAQTVVRRLREAAERENVKSVVLRVNSPGGSAMAADVIWREVELLKSKKPVVVSFGDAAASGGYYVSCPADYIVTTPYTFTGSIGVYGLSLNYADGLQRHLKIRYDGVGTSPSADFGITPRKMNAVERAAMMKGVNQVYDKFTSCVSKGRNMQMSEVEKVAGGAVWTGAEATENGLADSGGGLKYAVAYAADIAGLAAGDYVVDEIVEEPTGLDLLLSSMFVKAEVLGILKSLSDLGFLHSVVDEVTSEIQMVERTQGDGAMMLDYLKLKN